MRSVAALKDFKIWIFLLRKLLKTLLQVDLWMDRQSDTELFIFHSFIWFFHLIKCIEIDQRWNHQR